MSKAMAIREGHLRSRDERGDYTVSVVGCGWTGLSTACLLAEAGFKVICVDKNRSVVNSIRRGISPLPESGLATLVREEVRRRNLTATSKPEEAIPSSDIIILAVPVTVDQKKRPDYLNVEIACRDVGLNLQRGSLIIVQSALCPGMTEGLIRSALETASGMKAGVDFGLAYSPVRISGGTIEDLRRYPRVLGAIDEDSLRVAREVLCTISREGVVQVRSIKAAEAVRLFESVYRDVNKALSNELSHFCEVAGIDFIEVQRAINMHPRYRLLHPGIVDRRTSTDSYLLIDEAEALGLKVRTVTLSRRVNDRVLMRVFYLVRDALRSCGKTARRSRVLILGISHSPNVKEADESVIRELIEILERKGLTVKVFDPLFSYREVVQMGYPTERTLSGALKNMDCLVITVGHDKFKTLNLKRVRILMRRKAAIVDLSHVMNPEEVEREGFIYRGLGRGVWTR